MDGDGFLNAQQTLHSGPANTDANYDNCPSVYNPSQLNSDGNFVDLSPPKAFDDVTLTRSDALGDACDADDDNDGRTDAQETAGSSCQNRTSDPLLSDTDGDLVLDGPECALGTDPSSVTSVPAFAACGATTDADGDGIILSREYCYYGTDPNSANSDGDGCGDGREMASINADLVVNALDNSQLAQAFGPYSLPAPAYLRDFDLTKDGQISAADLSQLAQQFGSCP